MLTLIAQGLSNREVPERLFLSEGKDVVSEICARLQVRNRMQAALRAWGVLGEPER